MRLPGVSTATEVLEGVSSPRDEQIGLGRTRYVVGWVAHRESATLTEQFIPATCARQEIG